MHNKFESQGFWERRHQDGKWGEGKEPEARLIGFFKKYGNEIGNKILDIASGDGRHLVPLAEMGYEVTGLDFALTGLKVTEEKLKNKGLTANLVQGDFHALPFEPGSFDSAYSTQALNRNDWEGAKQTFKEVARILKPGGLFFLRVRSSSIGTQPKEGEIVEIIEEPYDPLIPVQDRGITFAKSKAGEEHAVTHAYSLEELRKLGLMHGLEIIDEPVDEKKPGVPGQWNVIFRKSITPDRTEN